MRLLFRELLRAPTRWAVVVVAATILAQLGTDQSWRAGWPDLAAALAGASALASPFAAGLTAYLTASRSRAGMVALEASARRPRWQVNGLLTFTAFLHALVGLLIAVSVSVVLILATSPAGTVWDWTAYGGAAVAYLALGVGAGSTLGRLIPSPRTTPVFVFLGLYLFWALVGVPVSGPPGLVPAGSAVALLLLVGVAALLVALLAPTPASVRPVQCLGVGAALAFVFLVASTSGEEALQRPRERAEFVCSDDGRICVWPEHAHHLGELTSGLARVDRFADAGITIDGPLRERGLPVGGGTEFDFPPAWFAFAAFGSAAVADAWECGEQANVADAIVESSHELMVWVTLVAADGAPPQSVGGGPTTVDIDDIIGVTQRPEGQQRDWVKQRVHTLSQACGS